MFEEHGKISDEKSVRFGIREITSELTDQGYRLFQINGKPLLIRGAGWSQDMLLREDPSRLRDQFRAGAGHASEYHSPGREAGDGGFLPVSR